jgi:PLP dependent protein
LTHFAENRMIPTGSARGAKPHEDFSVFMSAILQNYHRIQERIASAAERVGRNSADITLLAVTKGRPVVDIQELLAGGVRDFGENRVPETLEKVEAIGSADAPHWHFIGHLQTNKVKKLVGRMALLHGVDSLHLAEALQRACELRDCTQDLLLEVNVSGEESKYGLNPDAVEAIAEGLKPFDRLCAVGLMTMAPYTFELEETRPVFRGLRELRDRLREAGHVNLQHLSMGMSHDFEIAVEEGATLARVGSALFENV